jgi:hypothetical protein
MSTTYTFKIDNVEVMETQSIVKNVTWTLTASDSKNNASVYTTTQIEFNSSSSFTPYDQLTEDQIIQWVKDTLGECIDLYKNVADAKLKKLQEVAKVDLTEIAIPKKLPWLQVAQPE